MIQSPQDAALTQSTFSEVVTEKSAISVASTMDAPDEVVAVRLPGTHVTGRAFVLGLCLSVGLAALNCWIETLANVHFLGGVQMPFGAVFALGFLILVVNAPLRRLQSVVPAARVFSPLSAVELMTVYAMLLFAALVSTPGADNFFITIGPALFYFSTRENAWADLFYKHVPSWFAPGWDGTTYQRKIIEPLYTGGLSWQEIPWHAWTAMLLAWSVFLLLVYITLFFSSLLLRRQWIEHEALTFPLIQLPLQMVETDAQSTFPPAHVFWRNRTMWFGFTLAVLLHVLRGLNNYYPDWPALSGFQGQAISLDFTERPWNAIGSVRFEIFLGGIGIAYLLTREMALSFWVFFLAGNFQMVLAEQIGFSAAGLPRDTYLGRPTFITWQGVGAWMMMAGLLLWSARTHLKQMWVAAIRGTPSDEPFAPRLVVSGWLLSVSALLAWSSFAGINVLVAVAFFAIYLLSSLVLARLVIEGGLLFPQVTFSPVEVLTTGVFGTSFIGADGLTRLSFLQPVMMSDMRTNVLPAFLHTLKIAQEMKLGHADVRRLMVSSLMAIVAALATTVVVSVWTLYSAGGLSGYTWFTQDGGKMVFNGATTTLNTHSGVEVSNWAWFSVGAAVTMGLMLSRNWFTWFPLHPLGYLIASSYPLTRLWSSFFLGWLIKTLLLRFGGVQATMRVRPFMIGLILGNVSGMVVWMILGFWLGTQISYWPA